MTPYSLLLQKLFNLHLFGGVKYGLKHISQLDELLRCPSKAYKSIHVAGTNGKGSVTTKIAKALELEGFKVGLYTSPHLCTFRERIQINGMLISEEQVVNYLTHIFNICEDNQIPATFFEVTTALAFLFFAEQNVDYAVIETGLGGRLDATNILSPKLSVITSISLEHTEVLGNTIEEICAEKAGIIKSKTPVVIGPRVPSEMIQGIAKKLHCSCVQVKGTFSSYNEENTAIAKAALQFLPVSEKNQVIGLQTLPLGRLQRLEKQVGNQNVPIVLDVAHNEDGLKALFHWLNQTYPNQTFRTVFALSKNKDAKRCLSVLNAHCTHVHLCEASNGRSTAIEDLEKQLQVGEVYLEKSPQQAFLNALSLAAQAKEGVIVCGTFFIMGDIFKALSLPYIYDPIDLNEKKLS